MRPFKMFFGLSLAIMLFFVVAKFFVFAFIAAAIMSILYAVIRRVKDFITYDSYGQPYFKAHYRRPDLRQHWQQEVEPLFYGSSAGYRGSNEAIRFVDIK